MTVNTNPNRRSRRSVQQSPQDGDTSVPEIEEKYSKEREFF